MIDDAKRLNVVVGKEVHRALKIEVAKQGTTIGRFVAEAIREKIERDNTKE